MAINSLLSTEGQNQAIMKASKRLPGHWPREAQRASSAQHWLSEILGVPVVHLSGWRWCLHLLRLPTMSVFHATSPSTPLSQAISKWTILILQVQNPSRYSGGDRSRAPRWWGSWQWGLLHKVVGRLGRCNHFRKWFGAILYGWTAHTNNLARDPSPRYIPWELLHLCERHVQGCSKKNGL